MSKSVSSDSRKTYLAVKVDVVDSRRASDRSALQRQLFAATDTCNSRLGEAVAARFVVTHGDEVQGMLHTPASEALVSCLEVWVDALRPHQLRFGIGAGSLSTPLRQEAIGMDGEAWYRAKEAVDTAHGRRKHLHISGLPGDGDRVIAAVANLLLTLRTDWTDKQLHAVGLVERYDTQQEAAAAMGVTPTTFSRHLAAAHWHEYREGRTALKLLMAELYTKGD